MAVVPWPVSVPSNPLYGTIAVSRTSEPPLSSDMNSGTTRRRKKYTLRIGEYDFQIMMTNAQADLFKSFHEDSLFDGAERFSIPLYFAGITQTKTALFREPPTYEHVTQSHVKVSLMLLVEEL